MKGSLRYESFSVRRSPAGKLIQSVLCLACGAVGIALLFVPFDAFGPFIATCLFAVAAIEVWPIRYRLYADRLVLQHILPLWVQPLAELRLVRRGRGSVPIAAIGLEGLLLDFGGSQRVVVTNEEDEFLSALQARCGELRIYGSELRTSIEASDVATLPN